MKCFIVLIVNFVVCFGISTFPLVLIVSIDGFWPGYLKDYEEVTPYMHELAASGVTAPWMENVFLTKTLPNHQSIATGVFVESHGIVANKFYDSELKDAFNDTDRDAKWWDTTGIVPLWILNQLVNQNRFSGAMQWPGGNAWYRNRTAFYSEPYYSNRTRKDLIDNVIRWFLNDTRPANLVFLYFPEPDLSGHLFGPNSKEVKEEVAKTDQAIGYLKERLIEADLYSKMNIILLSDHGMSEVKLENVIIMDQILNHSYRYYGSAPAWHIYPDEGKEDFVYETFRNASEVSGFKFKIIKKEDIPTELHYKNNKRISPYLLLAEEGNDIMPYNKSVNLSETYGNHGYNKSEKMNAFFIAHGPAFKNGYVAKPFRNIDLFPLLCHILHMIPEHNNGSLINVMEMLKYPFGLHVTHKWLVAVCSILGICLLIAIASAWLSHSKNDDFRGSDRGTSAKEENRYLLVSPSEVDEV